MGVGVGVGRQVVLGGGRRRLHRLPGRGHVVRRRQVRRGVPLGAQVPHGARLLGLGQRPVGVAGGVAGGGLAGVARVGVARLVTRLVARLVAHLVARVAGVEAMVSGLVRVRV